MTPEEARPLLMAAFPKADPDDIETYLLGPDDPDSYFAKLGDSDELIEDFASFHE